MGGALHDAAISIGTRPTFDGEEMRVEAYLLDFSGDLYGKPLDLHVIGRLRDEERFGDLPALIAQISRDVDATREQLTLRRSAGLQP